MVRLQTATTRSDAGPILGALGALGLTVAFVALRRSKPRRGYEDGDKRKALATYLRDHLAGADSAIQMVQGLSNAYRAALRAPSSSRCPNSSAKTAASESPSFVSMLSATPTFTVSSWRDRVELR